MLSVTSALDNHILSVDLDNADDNVSLTVDDKASVDTDDDELIVSDLIAGTNKRFSLFDVESVVIKDHGGNDTLLLQGDVRLSGADGNGNSLSLEAVETTILDGRYRLDRSLEVTLGNTITDTTGAELTIAGDASVSVSTSISLGDDASNQLGVVGNAHFESASISIGTGGTANFGTLTFESDGTVTVREESSTRIENTNTAGQLSIESGGSIADVTGSQITVDNNASFSGLSVSIGTEGTAAFGSLTFNATEKVSIRDMSATGIFATNTAGSLDLTSSGAITDDAGATITTTGNATFTANSGSSDIILNNAGAHKFGSLTVVGQNVVVHEFDDTDLAGTNSIRQAFELRSGGYIVDANEATIKVLGSATFDAAAGVGNISLDNRGVHTFATLTIAGNHVTVVEKDATMLSGTSVAFGDFTLVSGGNVVEFDATSALAVTGEARISASDGLGDTTLDNPLAHTFGGLAIEGHDVVIAEANDTSFVGFSTITGDLDVASDGSIADSPGAVIAVSGTAAFIASSGTGNVRLNNQAGHSFGKFRVTAMETELVEKDGTELTGMSVVTGNLRLDSGGDITDGTVAMLTVGGDAVLKTYDDIALDNFTGHAFGTLNITGMNVTVVEKDGTDFAGTNTVMGDLDVDSGVTLGGDIRDGATATLTVLGDAAFTAPGDIELNNVDAHAFGRLTVNGTSATIVETDGTRFVGMSNMAVNLNVTSGGAITDATGAMVTVGGAAVLNAHGGADDILLDSTVGHAFTTVNVTGHDVTIVEKDDTDFEGTNTITGNLDVDSGGGITDGAAATLTVVGLADFNAVSWNSVWRTIENRTLVFYWSTTTGADS